MAAIFEDVAITYAGKQYTVKPTFDMINRVEMSKVSGGLGISLAGLTARVSRGDAPVTEVAKILALMLVSAGADATPEDVYVEIMTGTDARPLIEAVTSAFFPVVRTQTEKADGKKK